jgi:hypothetical protein
MMAREGRPRTYYDARALPLDEYIRRAPPVVGHGDLYTAGEEQAFTTFDDACARHHHPYPAELPDRRWSD